MTNTTYYNLNIVEGTDIVNPLTVDNPNYQKIDETMHDNAVAGVTLATELTNATIHALTRENSECSVIRFIATSRWKAGDSVTVDGVPVLASLPSGETLPDGAYVINANVLCVLTGTNLTVYLSKSSANASDITYNETNVEQALNSLNESMVTVTSDLSTVSSNVSTINSNLSRYNPNTDSFDIYYNGELVGSLPCNFQKIDIYSNGTFKNGASYVGSDGTTVTTTDNIVMAGKSAGNYKGFTINVPELERYKLIGKKLVIKAKADVGNVSLVVAMASTANSHDNMEGNKLFDLGTSYNTYTIDLSEFTINDIYKYLYIGLYVTADNNTRTVTISDIYV